MKQEELIKRLSHKQLLQALYQSQLLFLLIALLLSYFFFERFSTWLHLFTFDLQEIVFYGVIPGIIVILYNLLLKYLLPKRVLDDGGLNEKLFKNSTLGEIFQISLLVSVCEEALFRGLLQTKFGLVFASLTFAFIHFRYLKKPILLLSITAISFYFGYLYFKTGNLLVTIVAHFVIDFVLGLLIRLEK